ncbi:CRISPR-associated protein Cas4 [Anaerocolumna cellulosilytica]|nr:CRISPR-associated protein Cas4 [Anaerocolumna cellulosilytica]
MTEYKEEDYLMLSGIQHFSFCRRQWALIHIEKQWDENVRTVEGNIIHQKAHNNMFDEKRKNIIISRGMPIYSNSLGTSGECDIVEFHKADDGINLVGEEGLYQVFPIEYKRGKEKEEDADRLQLAAQAMCLEEMLSCQIKEGYLYYHEIRRRTKVIVDNELRQKVYEMFIEMHQMFERKYTPKVKRAKRCNACSLKNICLPQLNSVSTVQEYMNRMLGEDNE